MEFRGEVVKKPFAVGSKSERDAVKIITQEGEFVLRRQGGNPFFDPELDQLVGKFIHGQGTQHENHLILTSWEEE